MVVDPAGFPFIGYRNSCRGAGGAPEHPRKGRVGLMLGEEAANGWARQVWANGFENQVIHLGYNNNDPSSPTFEAANRLDHVCLVLCWISSICGSLLKQSSPKFLN